MSMPKLLEMALQLAVAEEIRHNAIARSEKEDRGKHHRVIMLNNIRLPREVLSVNGSGTLEELTVFSTSKDYGVEIVADGSKIMTKSWDELNKMSPYVSWVVAVEDNGLYVMTLSKISFSKGIKVTLYPTSREVVVDSIVIKVEK